MPIRLGICQEAGWSGQSETESWHINWKPGTTDPRPFVCARKDAWHRLATVLPAEFDAAQAMRHPRLGGWKVRKEALQTVPLIDVDGVTAPLPVPDQFATVRTNPLTGATEVLGVVGAGYTPIQNEAHADLLNSLVSEYGSMGVDLPGGVAICPIVQVTS